MKVIGFVDVNRNAQCPCGSGFRFKKCHGALSSFGGGGIGIIRGIHKRVEFENYRREKQQGYGRPIISTNLGGTRFVAVGGTLHWSDRWATFHSFLFDYLRLAFGQQWCVVNSLGSVRPSHPVTQWMQAILNSPSQQLDGLRAREMDGAAAAYLHLSYDLYCLAHNVETQERLLARLRDADQFWGAAYEAKVAAILTRAGFDVVFEDESDRKTTHCELVATYAATGRKFSVECKRRQPQRRRNSADVRRVGKCLVRALRKRAENSRIVFIDIDVPLTANVDEKPTWLLDAVRQIRDFETNPANGAGLPPAYVVLTNEPFRHFVGKPAPASFVLLEGFKIPGYRFDAPSTLRDAIKIRDECPEIEGLLRSLPRHSVIPATFDGENPHLAFKETEQPRLLVGETYEVEEGRLGKLMEAAVLGSEAMCILQFDNGERSIYSFKLSESELAAYEEDPETFFGAINKINRDAKTPLDLYDFFVRSRVNTSHAQLLRLLPPNEWGLWRDVDRDSLAKEIATREVEIILRRDQELQNWGRKR